jgi:hypothetical protein
VGKRPWWEVNAILAAAAQNWTLIDGSAALRGGDPGSLPLDRLCNLTWTYLAEHMEEERWNQWVSAVTTPPPGALASPRALPALGDPFAYAAAGGLEVTADGSDGR